MGAVTGGARKSGHPARRCVCSFVTRCNDNETGDDDEDDGDKKDLECFRALIMESPLMLVVIDRRAAEHALVIPVEPAREGH